MIQLVYPTKKPVIKTVSGKESIFCSIRKKWFLLTPEEWVRQNFLIYLIDVLNFPASLIAVEKQITIAALKKRFDIVVYKDAMPYIIIECKEMNVPLSENTLLQVLNYNASVQAAYVVVTNGSYCKAFFSSLAGFEEIFELPHL
jgi:hypothetical protein